jgi:membrane protease YdiL (CAAX protease family)
MNLQQRFVTVLAVGTYFLLLVGFWFEVNAAGISKMLGGHIPSAFICFGLLLIPLWTFGFGFGDWLRETLRSRLARILAPVGLAIPYLVFALPRGEFHWSHFGALAAIPVACSALIELSTLKPQFSWRDLVLLLAIALILELRVLSGAWPYPGLGSLPKLYLADVVLYVYVVVRRLDGIGYSFIPSKTAISIGVREWLFFAPIGIGLGLALHFIRFYPRAHSALNVIAALVITFLLTAVPEELFFRGILQNLLEPTLGRSNSLLLASALFGLSHFHKGAMFNWRYVLLAFIAGLFYGRAWRSKRQLLASSITHTLVDAVWSLWFR